MILRSLLNFISDLFENYFIVGFLSHFAGNSGLFPKNKKEKMHKIASKKPKQTQRNKNYFLIKFKMLLNYIQITLSLQMWPMPNRPLSYNKNSYNNKS